MYASRVTWGRKANEKCKIVMATNHMVRGNVDGSTTIAHGYKGEPYREDNHLCRRSDTRDCTVVRSADCTDCTVHGLVHALPMLEKRQSETCLYWIDSTALGQSLSIQRTKMACLRRRSDLMSERRCLRTSWVSSLLKTLWTCASLCLWGTPYKPGYRLATVSLSGSRKSRSPSPPGRKKINKK